MLPQIATKVKARYKRNKYKAMDLTAEQIYGIIQKLTGKIRPVGESNEDAQRLENVKTFIKVFDMMHVEIDAIGYEYIDSHEASVLRIAETCNEHIDSMGICDGECGGKKDDTGESNCTIQNVTNSNFVVKIDDTTAFGCSHHNHDKHRVYIDGLKYDEALMLQKIITNVIS